MVHAEKFLWSELLLMTAAIGICISVLIDDRNNTKDTDKPKYLVHYQASS